MTLQVAWCSRKAAEHAVMNWHYTHSMPCGKLMCLGAWDDGRFFGAIIYGRGASPTIALPFGLQQTEVVELVRVALKTGHGFPTSKALGFSLKMIKKSAPGIKAIVSYADMAQGHHGGIYQATNWIYLGPMTHKHFMIKGKFVHTRSVSSLYGTTSLPFLKARVDPEAKGVDTPPKHKYVFSFCQILKKELQKKAKPYPKKT